MEQYELYIQIRTRCDHCGWRHLWSRWSADLSSVDPTKEADDSTEDAVARELQEETGLSGLNLEQFFTFSKRGRDPRERTISIAYWAVVDMNQMHPKAADDAKAVRWYQLSELPELAFDHAQIIAKAVESSGVLG